MTKPLICDRLLCGVEYNGVRHYDIEMRLPTVNDNIRAIDAYPDGNSVQIEMAMMAYAVTRLGEIPLDEVTCELLGTIVPSDYDRLGELLAEAKKKLFASTGA